MPIPEFIVELRALVGTRPLWLPGVTAVILDAADRVLLVRRVDNGLWGLVSGILEPGEEPALCAVRESAEEAGVSIEVLALAHVSVSPAVRYPNGDRAQYLDLTFLCRHVAGEAHVADDEATDVRWFALDDLPADLTASSRHRLRNTLQFRREPGAGTRFARP